MRLLGNAVHRISAAICFAAILQGCSLIGLGVDVAHHGPRAGDGPALATLHEVTPGSRIALTLTDGSRIEGRYEGIGSQPGPGWRALDAARRESDAAWRTLPACGDTVELEQSGIFRGNVEFEGLDVRGIVVRDAGRPSCRVLGYSDFSAIRHGGVSLGAESLRALARDPEVPLEDRVRVVREDGVVALAPEQVAGWTVLRAAARGPRWTLLGILADVLVLVWIQRTFVYSG
ncbi:MAG: hypothetical protein U0704_12610 [Candidatus Eisenbacteria bacterium]